MSYVTPLAIEWPHTLSIMALTALSTASQAQSFAGTPAQRCQRALINLTTPAAPAAS